MPIRLICSDIDGTLLQYGRKELEGEIFEQIRELQMCIRDRGYIVLGDVAPINSFSPTPKLFDDSQIPAFKALADSVHAYGTKLGIQIFHPEYDVDAINSLFMQKKFDEMRQRLHHDMMRR